MGQLIRHSLTPAETGAALRALCEWTPPGSPAGGLHPGDLGWYLRFEDAVVFLWTDYSVPVAAGFIDGTVLRVTAAPHTNPHALAEALLPLQPTRSRAPRSPSIAGAP